MDLKKCDMPTLTEDFDDKIQSLVNERGAVYGHPLDHFRRAAQMKAPLEECADPEIRHALGMIAIKMARLIETPDHLDSIFDIAGYARTMCMIHDRRKEET